ncbi:MAG: lipopolysaccharide-assembly, LptC-related protein [Beijerinckiaceae bacterium]|jgi:lipopolysaccharide export system protein LptC
MTERALELDPPRLAAAAPAPQAGRAPQPDRARAFRDAGRHTRLVRALRFGIVAGGIALVAAAAAFPLLGRLGGASVDLSLARATLDGTRVTMESPRLNGFRKDGRPYEVRARAGVQDVRTPKIIELSGVEATLQTADRTSVRVVAPEGVFDSGADLMRLSGGAGGAGVVRLTSASGFDVELRNAEMDFKTGALRSGEPVKVRMTNGVVDADSLDVAGNGAAVSFIGNVRSVIVPEAGMRAGADPERGSEQGKAE